MSALKIAMEELDYSVEALDQLVMMESKPPFEETYKELFENYDSMKKVSKQHDLNFVAVEEAELPLIDLQRLREGDGADREECKREMEAASKEWGFFQVVNHGISGEILEGMRREQVRGFREPFYRKEEKALAAAGVDVMSPGSYRWGTSTATCLRQLSWSEAFHIPLIKIPCFGGLTIQAWSNGTYKSVEHRVVANQKMERFSTAYFLCPSYDAVIQSHKECPFYRKFSFKEYRQQVQDDVKDFGHKIWLSRFLIRS